jgi:tetratricopeptide (TPR) repeat protein
MADLTGTTFSHYRILDEVGHGGMGIVYRAEDLHLNRPVALKFLSANLVQTDSDRKRFAREARAAAQIAHPNIATVFDFDEAEDPITKGRRAFIAMEFVEGESLKARITRGELPIAEVRSLCVQIANALQSAHRHGIVHRDLKPANVLVNTDGMVKLLDFGIAKLGGDVGVTEPGRVLGSVAYMSPEQVRGDEVDERTDIWSFGVLLFELLTGTLPFRGEHPPAMMYSIGNEQPPDIASLRPDVPEDLRLVCRRCLEKDRSTRPRSMGDILASMGVTSDTTHERARRPSGWVKRKRRIVLGAAGVLLIVAGLALTRPSAVDSVLGWLGLYRVPAEKHLAVLPFTNVGGSAENQPFCDGLMEIVTSKLSQFEQFHQSLWVVPSVEVLKHASVGTLTPARATTALGVTLVVTGSVQKISDRIRLTLNLIDARRSRQLRSVVIDDPTSNLAAVQDKAAASLAEMLQLELTPGTLRTLRAGETQSSDAYEAYLQARGFMQRYEKTENIDAAIRLFQLAASRDSTFALAYAGLGEAYWRKFRATKERPWLDRAITSCSHAVELNDRLPQVLVMLGLLHTSSGQNEESMVYFRRALELDSVNVDATRGLARAFEAIGKLPEAESTFKRAVSLQPDYWGIHNDLGAFYARHGRFTDAAGEFGQVVALTPDNFWGYNNLGAVYLQADKPAEARRQYEQSISIQPNYGAYSNLGTLFFSEARYADAALNYEKALAIDDRSYTIWGNLASTYQWVPDSRQKMQDAASKAITLAEQQRDINPHDAVVLSDLAGYYAMIDNRTKAQAMLRDALAVSPADAEILAQAVQVYERSGDRKEALRWLEKAVANGYAAESLDRNPELSRLRQDPQYRAILERARAKR